MRAVEISGRPDLATLAAEVQASRESVLLQQDETTLAVVRPAAMRRSSRQRPVSKDDALWGIVGIAECKDATEVSTNKQKYFAEAYKHTAD